MSAINFVVLDIAGNISRGSVSGEGAPSSLVVGAGADVSLNLTQGQIVSYTRQGQALEITLIDGRTIVIEGFFTMEGVTENELFLSADGFMTEVQLTSGAGADYYASYVQGDGAVGKFAMKDDLYFMRSSDVMLAESYVPVDDEVGMLGAALGGLAPLFGWGGAAAAGAAAVIVGGGGGPTAPEVVITGGTDTNDHIVNEAEVSPSNIANVIPGQTATIKLSAYDYTVYGSLTGEVHLISADTFEDERDPNAPAHYRVTLRVETTNLDARQSQIEIRPGMQADVELHTGSKTVLQYLTKPLYRGQEALREP